MIAKLLGLPPERRQAPTTALALLPVRDGARVVRVHDAGPTVEAIRALEYRRRAAEGHRRALPGGGARAK